LQIKKSNQVKSQEKLTSSIQNEKRGD